MVNIISTTEPVGSQLSEWRYNGLDSMITLEVFQAIEPQLDEITRPVYNRALALQGPILEMECRGIKVDKEHVAKVSKELEGQLATLNASLKEIMMEGVGLTLDEVEATKKVKGVPKTTYMWNSPKQLMEFFYGRMGLSRTFKQGKPTIDRDALEKLQANFIVEPIIAHILKIRDITKSLGVLRTGLEKGRMHFSINIAGTNTGRLASYGSAFGSGTNIQNLTEELRQILVADPGKKLAYIDRAQIQSRIVGAICWNLFGDSTYLDFCESGDLHTGVCMMTWPDKAWTYVEGDKSVNGILSSLKDPSVYKLNRAIANEQFYRVDSFRQASKKLGHATNFLGGPREVSRQTRIPVALIDEFQRTYLNRAFPSIREWQAWLKKKLITDGWITTMAGRRRWFFGRRWDDKTVKEAAAYEPQDVEAYINQTGMLQLWRASRQGHPLYKHVDILLPAHDAIVIQYPETAEQEILQNITDVLRVPVELMNGRVLDVPCDIQVGWNWRHKDKAGVINPDGMIEYGGVDDRKRSKKVSFLDRSFY